MATAVNCKDPKEMYALKQKAMKYYEENGVPEKVEEILNSMFYDDPADVYGHLVNFFSQFVKPATLKRISAFQVFDAMGLPTIQTNAYGTVNNQEQLLSSSIIANANLLVKVEDGEKAEVELQQSVAAAIELINSSLNAVLEDFDPTQQSQVDQILLAEMERKREVDLAKKKEEEENAEEHPPPQVAPPEDKDKKKSAKGKAGGKTSAPLPTIPDRPLEKFVLGCEAVASVSQAVCVCAAAAGQLPVYRHVGNLARVKGALNEFQVPLPMVTIVQCGKQMPGKLKCVKEYMVVPGVNMPADQSIEHIQHIYQHVAKSFCTKLGPSAKFVNEVGALCPQLDSPTQALELLQEAVNAQGLTIGEDIYLAINAAAHDFFDHEKGRYEVMTGTMKSPDDMVDFWVDIITKYPSIVAIIDPIRGEDREQWMKLSERVSESLFVVGDRFYERPGVLKLNDPPSPIQTSGIVMRMERMNTVSDIIHCANLFKEQGNELVISANPGDTTDTFIVDLAVGLGARFLKVGAPCRGERSSKLNRLIQILAELEPAEVKEEDEEEEEKSPASAAISEREKSEGMMEETERVEGTEGEQGVEEEVKEGVITLPQTWGKEEKGRLKLHTPFIFPLIENPPPPVEDGEEEGEKEEK